MISVRDQGQDLDPRPKYFNVWLGFGQNAVCYQLRKTILNVNVNMNVNVTTGFPTCLLPDT